MNALAIAEAASVGHPRFRPEAHERGLKILRQELLEDRPRRITISRRIATLLREREESKEALRAASARSSLPPEPAELKVTYRGPFGSLKIDVDPEWIREMLPTARRAPTAGGDFASSCACTRNTTVSFGPIARSQASVPWPTRGSGSKTSWKRWQRRLVL